MLKASVTGSQFYAFQAGTGRLTSVVCSNGITLSYGNFDAASRPQQLTYTIPGLASQVENVTYKSNGSLASLDLPEQDKIDYTYNAEKRLSQVKQGTSEVYVFSYDDRGLATSLSYPSTASLALAYAWTLDGRPEAMELTATTSEDPLASLAYDYDAYGKVASIERADVQADHQAAGTQDFTWDRLGRLAACDSSHTGSDEAYRYDARSNLEEKQRGDIIEGTMTAAETTDFAHDAAGRIEKETKGASETLYHYDQAGRLESKSSGTTTLATYTYDGADRLTAAQENGADVDYLYDSAGRMLARTQTDAQGTTHAAFLPSGASQEAGVVYGWGDGETPQVSYSYVSDPAGTRLAQTDYATEGTGTTYPFRDPRGDVLDLATPEGTLADAYAYTPFGELEPGFTAENTPFLYQDDYRDPATELYQMQARWYDPSSARFLSLDPKMGDAADPLRRLPYTYCANDPVYNSDPSGEGFLSGIIDLAQGLASLVTGGSQGNNPQNASTSKAGRGIIGGFKGMIRNIERCLSLAAKSLSTRPTTIVRSGNWSVELDIRFPTNASEREAMIESLSALADTESGRELLSQLDINQNGRTTINLSYKDFGIFNNLGCQQFGETSQSFGEKLYHYAKQVGRFLVSPIWGLNGEDSIREFDVSIHSEYKNSDPRIGAFTLAHELQHVVNMRDNKSISKGHNEMAAYRTEYRVFKEMAKGILGRPLGIERPWKKDPFMPGNYFIDSTAVPAWANESDVRIVRQALGLNSESTLANNLLTMETNSNVQLNEGYYDEGYLIDYYESHP